MTRRTRRTIFYVLLILFFLIGGGAVLYANGWRLNFATFHAEKVGGIFVRPFPDNAAITLNGKPVPNQSNFLSHGTLISDLFPENYTLGLTEPGYDSWHENASVLPSLVTTMKYAVLVPQAATPIATTSDIQNFFVIGNDYVAQHASGTITWRNITIGNGTIVSHSTDLKTMVFEDTSGNYMLYDFTMPTQKPLNLTALLQQNGVNVSAISEVMIDPYDETSLFVITKTHVWTVDIDPESVTSIAVASSGDSFAPTIASSPSLLAWSEMQAASGTSRIFIYDKFAGVVTDQSLVLPAATQSLQWVDGNTLGVLQGDGALSFYNLSSQTPRAVASDVKDFYPTTDGTMLAALENQSIEVFDFSTGDYYRFNLPEVGTIQSLIWYKDQTHLFVNYPDHVSFLDLADTSLANFTTVSEGTAAFYDPQANSLYLANPSGDLVRFDFPS